MTHAVVTVNGAGTLLPTILGQGAVRIPIGGKVRAGIKTLTKTAASNPKAKALYERGVEANKSFEEIEREIVEAVPEIKHPLTPKNVPWFTVRPQDFPNREIAQQIMDACGEDRGDGVKRLYRFPVVWPADMWQVVMPHELVAWGANERKFWSEYSPDGQVRYCKCYAAVPKDATGRRAIRIFGGRKVALRSENGGVCNPESCAEFQSRQCNLSGRFIFYIPGVKSINAFELGTNSFYAMNAAIQKFQAIAFMRGGRICGFLDGRQTPFYITKRLMEVPHIDEDGRAVRVKQWIIELEAPVDVAGLLRVNEDEEVTVRANKAARVLDGQAAAAENEEQGVGSPAPSGDQETVPDTVTMPSGPSRAAPGADGQQEERIGAEPVPTSAERVITDGGRKAAARRVSEAMPDAATPSFQEVVAMAAELGIEPVRFEQYANKRWGPGWKGNEGGRRRVAREVQSFHGDPAALVAKINAELDVFA